MSKRFQQHLNLRMMSNDGWLYFCRQCGDYLPEDQFHKRKGTTWGYNSSCKNHGQHIKTEYDADMEYLKLNPITENDFIEMRKFLKQMGYCFDCGKTVHEQFLDKHPQLKKK